MRITAAIGAVIALAGCASGPGERAEPDPDPFEPVNRAIFRFNDVADRYVGKPVARGYKRGTPGALRAGISNFLDNLRYPVTIINNFLQGKPREGGSDLARMALNSTVGLFGLFDPATAVGLPAHDEDFGQTFSVWGLPEGPFLMVPLLGPYTASSGIGDLIGTQVSPLVQAPDGGTAVALWTLYFVDRRYRVLDFDEEIQQAFDPYLFIRDAYLQNRRFRILDGNVPEEELYPEDEFDEETDEAP